MYEPALSHKNMYTLGLKYKCINKPIPLERLENSLLVSMASALAVFDASPHDCKGKLSQFAGCTD